MGQFPFSEGEIVQLGQLVASGLQERGDVFPNPPVLPAALEARIETFVAARHEAVTAAALAKMATQARKKALRELKDDIKSDLRYAENTVKYDDDKLKLLGWSGRRAKKELQIPGQVRALEAPVEGEGWLLLDWKEPWDGGKAAAYEVERRIVPEEKWSHVATAMKTEIRLSDQPRGKELEFRVLATNKAGEGMPSNTVMAVL